MGIKKKLFFAFEWKLEYSYTRIYNIIHNLLFNYIWTETGWTNSKTSLYNTPRIYDFLKNKRVYITMSQSTPSWNRMPGVYHNV